MMKVERNSSADVVLNSEHSQSTLFWKPSVLELVEEVLRPPEGGSPYLPEYSDAVKLYLSLSLSFSASIYLVFVSYCVMIPKLVILKKSGLFGLYNPNRVCIL